MAVSVGEDGEEGVCAFHLPGHGWMPLIAADERREPFVLGKAKELAHAQQMRIRIIRLHSREEVDVIDGRQ